MVKKGGFSLFSSTDEPAQVTEPAPVEVTEEEKPTELGTPIVARKKFLGFFGGKRRKSKKSSKKASKRKTANKKK